MAIPHHRLSHGVLLGLLCLIPLASTTAGEPEEPEEPSHPLYDEELWTEKQEALAVYEELSQEELDPDGAPPPLILLVEALDLWPPALAGFSWRRYDEVRQKSSHNAFQRDEALLDQLVYHRVRSLELDIHNDKGASWSPMFQDWYVYHHMADTGTTCHRLSDCLNELRAFHLANPGHEVVTVFLDLKDAWQPDRGPTDLDNRLTTHIPTSAIWGPAELLAACPEATHLQEAIDLCDWPLLDGLRGRFIFALTGSDERLDAYAAAGLPGARRAFIAPKIDDAGGIAARDAAVFFNLQMSDVDVGGNVSTAGFVSRAYYVNSSTDWFWATTYDVHHLATDKVNFHQDAWSRTHNAHGWPFECFDACAPALEEAGQVLGAEVDSGDIWGDEDGFFFLFEIGSASVTTVWTAAIDTRNSHTEDWAKGCLMARRSKKAGSPYFAVCRPNDDEPLRVQWRDEFDGSSDRTEANIVGADSIDEESITFVRLQIFNNGQCAAGFGSQNGVSFKHIGTRCFDVELLRQGVAVSSHDGGRIKFLFSNLEKNGVPYTVPTFPHAAAVGDVSSHAVFDGVFP